MKKLLAAGAVALGLALMPVKCRHTSKLQYESVWEFGVSAFAQEVQSNYSRDAKYIVNNAWDRMRALGARDDVRAREALDELIDKNQDGVVSAEEARDIVDVVFNPDSPIGRLWFRYDGPEPPIRPSYEDLHKIKGLYKRFERFEPVIRHLVDEDGDLHHSVDELYRAAYKVLGENF